MIRKISPDTSIVGGDFDEEFAVETKTTHTPLDKIRDLRHCSAIILRVYIKAMEAQYGTKHSRTDEQVSD
jgi:hypothetical protein